MFANIWSALFDEDGELARFKERLISVIVATVVGSLLILLFRPSIGTCLWITVLPWFFSFYRLFSIKPLVGLHLVGEVVEVGEALVANPTHPETGTSLFDNEISRTYVKIISGIFFFQTSLFLMLPLYVNYTVGGFTAMILVTMMSAMMIIISAKFSQKALVVASVAMMLVYSAGLILYLFPQIGFHTRGLTERIHVVPASTAQIAEEIKDLQAKQLEEIDNKYLNQVLEWQKANPGKEPPQWFKDALAKKRSLI